MDAKRFLTEHFVNQDAIQPGTKVLNERTITQLCNAVMRNSDLKHFLEKHPYIATAILQVDNIEDRDDLVSILESNTPEQLEDMMAGLTQTMNSMALTVTGGRHLSLASLATSPVQDQALLPVRQIPYPV